MLDLDRDRSCRFDSFASSAKLPAQLSMGHIPGHMQLQLRFVKLWCEAGTSLLEGRRAASCTGKMSSY